MPDPLKNSVEVDLVVVRDLEDRWPELFTGLSLRQRRDVVSRLLAEWVAGLPVDYESVRVLTDEKRGLIEPPEFL